MLSVTVWCKLRQGDTAVKGTVAEGEYRQVFILVKGNNIRFTVAFAESYRKIVMFCMHFMSAMP